MRVYDCFPFFNELDLLEVRLHEMYESVHRFVLVEATLTHQGAPKPLYFAGNKKRFEQFSDKIIHVVETFDGVPPDPWSRERAQRNRISREIEFFDKTDRVIITDLDEIPRAETVPVFCSDRSIEAYPVHLPLRMFYYFLNCEFKHIRWNQGFAALAGVLRGKNLSEIRVGSASIVSDFICGWHFGYLGGEDKIMEKLRAFAHSEFSNDATCNSNFIRTCIANERSLFSGDAFEVVPVDATFPKFVRDNLDTFQKKGFIRPWSPSKKP